MGISSSSLNLEDSFLDGEERNIEGSTTKIENQYVLLFSLLVKTVSDGGSSGLVNNTQYVQSSNGSSILGSLTLGVIEISWYSNNSILNLLSKVSLSNLLHLGKNHGGNLLSLELLGLSLVFNLDDGGSSGSRDDLERPVLHIRLYTGVSEGSSNKTLGIEYGVGSVHGSLGLGGISDKTLGFVEGNVGRGGSVTLVVGNNFNTIILPNSYT
mmetsp:Transcript_7097/g.8212  ORF Transcript_7097/g.8212 Transcript_7097/m.8212 type:complete len:212 (+) Transcript_7097:417-1052(+)